MANSPLAPFTLCGAGHQSVVISGALLDLMLIRLNVLSGVAVKPDSNVGTFYISKGAATIDLTDLDTRLRGIEGFVGFTSNTQTNVNTSIFTQVTNLQNATTILQANIVAFDARLSNASVTVNCVANAVIGVVHI